MKNNIYIKTWKNTILWVITSNQIIYESNKQEYTLSQKSNDIREMASRQLALLDNARPNKNETMYKQANEKQKEFIDYLEKVIVYGNLEGKETYKK